MSRRRISDSEFLYGLLRLAELLEVLPDEVEYVRLRQNVRQVTFGIDDGHAMRLSKQSA